MIPVTPEQLAQARALVAVRRNHAHALARLGSALERVKARNSSSSAQLTERLKLRPHPERLAGLAELAQRNPAGVRRQIALAYEFFLMDMIDPIALEMGAPKPRPRQVDFHTLHPSARPYLLGPYLDIHPGDRFARLCLDRSVPSRGNLVVIQTGGPIDADQWRGNIARINAWLGGTWAITDAGASTLTLIQRPEMPAQIPMRRDYLRNGAMFLGFNTETQQPTYLPFAEMTSGTCVVGAAGSGKSNATHLLMHSILANLHLFQAVFCVDGKEGMTFARYRAAAPAKLRILTDEPDLWALIRQLVVITRARNATLARQGLDKAPNNLIAVLIEEMSTYTAKPATDDKAVLKAHGQFINDLATLARKGRSAGLKILITAQDPTVEQIPASVRANCQTSLIFRLGLDQHATMMMGELQTGGDPRKLTTGRAILKRDNGTLSTVQFPVMPEPPRGRP